MSLHIKSTDVASGLSYNGTWNLNTNINGTLNLINYYIEQETVNWITSGAYLQYNMYPFGDTSANLLVQVNFSTQSTNIPDDIAAQFQTDFQAATVLENNTTFTAAATIPTTVTCEWTGSQYKFTFTNQTFTGGINFDWAIDFLYTSGTNVATLWNSPDTIFELPPGNGVQGYAYLTPSSSIGYGFPQYLYFTISNTIGGITTSNSYRPTLILSTWDVFTGLSMQINGQTKTLNIMISNPDDPSTPYVYTGIWHLIFN